MANHPYDKTRPETRRVKWAVDNDDMEALKTALTPRQLAFCKEYVVDFIGSRAAVRAGYSTKWPDRQATALLGNRGVSAYISHLSASKEAKIISIDPDYIIARVTEIISKEGSRDGDKLRGLELLARHLGMFVDRTEITGKDGGALEILNQQVAEDAQNFTQTMRLLRERALKEKKALSLV